MGLIGSPLARRCGAEEETSAYVLCECEALETLRYNYFGYFFLDPEDLRRLSLGQSGTLSKEQGSHELEISSRGTKGPVKKAYMHRDRKGSKQLIILFYYILL